MKKMVLLLLIIFSLVGCGKKDIQSDISDSIGIDVSKGTVLTDSDSHGGFHGDGMMFQQILFEDSDLSDEIKDNGNWNPMPLSENIEALVYGIEEGTSSIGPFLTDESGDPIIPDIQNGYYYFYDRHSESKEPLSDEDVLSRASFNFTLAVYDSDNHILYYVEFDT
ncbi:MAG: hypothetical protein MSA26_17025 [Lachnospiraceae bacterium]|nr:hypothetical protein [Lachnospiraceae bacterium]